MARKYRRGQKTPVKIAIGLKIRMRRLLLNLTQEELAEMANLHPNYLGSVERGERDIGIENLIVLAKTLGCSPKDLMPD